MSAPTDSKRARATSLVIAATLATAMCSARASATGSEGRSATAIMKNVIHQSDRFPSAECNVSIRFRESSFPYLSKTIAGTAYFRADRFAAVFTNVPSVLRTFPGAYDAMMDVGRWPARFEITSDANARMAGHTDDVLHLVAHDRSSGLQYGRAFVNPRTWTLDGMHWHFARMQFNIMQTYKRLGPFRVLAGQQATIHTTLARAGATATFAAYRTNVTIAPHVFAGHK